MPDLDKLAARLAAEVHVGIAHRGLRSNRPDLARYKAEKRRCNFRRRTASSNRPRQGSDGRHISDRRSPSIIALAAACWSDRRQGPAGSASVAAPRTKTRPVPKAASTPSETLKWRSITKLAFNAFQRRTMPRICPPPHASRLRWVLSGPQFAVISKLSASLPLGQRASAITASAQRRIPQAVAPTAREPRFEIAERAHAPGTRPWLWRQHKNVAYADVVPSHMFEDFYIRTGAGNERPDRLKIISTCICDQHTFEQTVWPP